LNRRPLGYEDIHLRNAEQIPGPPDGRPAPLVRPSASRAQTLGTTHYRATAPRAFRRSRWTAIWAQCSALCPYDV